MGGNFAKSTVRKWNEYAGEDRFEYSKFQFHDLGVVFGMPNGLPGIMDSSIISRLLAHLMKDRYIVEQPPELAVGSTRLAAAYYYNYKNIPHETYLIDNETWDNAEDALMQKDYSFGDIDIGVEYIKAKKEIAVEAQRFLQDHGFKCIVKNGSEIHIAIELRPGKVFQIDLPNIDGNVQALSYLQFSSFLDGAVGIKGNFRQVAIASLGRHGRLYGVEEILGNEDKIYIIPCPDKEAYYLNNYEGIDLHDWKAKGFDPGPQIRLVLNANGLFGVLDFFKPSTRKPGQMTKRTAKLFKVGCVSFSKKGMLHMAHAFFGVDGPHPSLSSSTLYHTRSIFKAAKEIMAPEVFDMFLTTFYDNIQYASPNMTAEEFEQGMQAIAEEVGISWQEFAGE